MSGDVQPRKRKDKKKKKDDLGIEEPRGTAAALGEGDVFMHSHHEHGTGGHWCAKVIFFSLLAVLVGLIGLIILENRGLSELEANSVESRYSGVLDGWIEDGHDDDHHDEHTLELNHHDDEDHDDHNDHNEDDSDVELEHIEEEVFDDVSNKPRSPARTPAESEEDSKEAAPVDDDDDDEVELLEPDDMDELDELPEELPIPVPKGRPLVEFEETSSTEKPQDTLADEEEYERQQEALRKEKEQASQGMWLKLVVGGALLVATQAVLRRATAPREPEDDVNTTREETPLSDRRMTLIGDPVPPESESPVTPKLQEVSRPVVQKEIVKQAPVLKSAPPPQEDDDEEEEIIVTKDTAGKESIDKELYSDEEEEEEDEEEEPPKPVPKPIPTKEPPKPLVKDTPKPVEKKEPPRVVEKEPTPEEDDDVEIIEEEELGEDLEEEEDEISDVDDAELLNRLEAKYGRLPEPDRPRQKDGGNSMEDEWPGEPSDAYWRDELDHAERDLRQDWLD